MLLEPWQRRGGDAAAAPRPVRHTPVSSPSPSEKFPFQVQETGRKMMITAGYFWVWGLREPCQWKAVSFREG